MPLHSDTAGSIIDEQAYALGKMLDNSSWNGLLTRHITPADIDIPDIPLVFDNDGAIIFADLSRTFDDWQTALPGQRWLYQSVIKGSRHCAALCKHSVRPEDRRLINTLTDVESFHIMVWDNEAVMSPLWPGSRWQEFVTTWVNLQDGPQRIRRRIIEAAKARPPTNGDYATAKGEGLSGPPPAESKVKITFNGTEEELQNVLSILEAARLPDNP